LLFAALNNKLLGHAMAGNRTGLSQATADRVARAAAIIQHIDRRRRRRPFNNLVGLLGILAVVVLAVVVSCMVLDGAVRP
jgi:hypothetical protein